MSAQKDLKKNFDIDLDWVELNYSNAQLHFWEAGFLEVQGELYRLQLRKHFEKHKKFLKMYDRSEVIAHECAHLGRMHFPKSQYEEILAYHTSSGLRKIIGPLFDKPIEVRWLLLCAVSSLVSDSLGWDVVGLVSKLALGASLTFLFARLYKRSRIFNRAKKRLQCFLKKPEQALAVLYRMNDKEVTLFARGSTNEVQNYMELQRELRWIVIRSEYLNGAELGKLGQ